MTAIPNNKLSILSAARKILNRNFSLYNKASTEESLTELQFAIRDLMQAVIELQTAQFGSRTLDSDGQPRHGSRCELLNGQFLRLLQTAAAGMILRVPHGLGRKPQGAIFVQQGLDNNLALIAGDTAASILPADETSIAFRLNGANGNLHICVIY